MTELKEVGKFPCPACGEQLTPTAALKVRAHRSKASPSDKCPGSGQSVTVNLDEKFLGRQSPADRERVERRLEERREAVQLAIGVDDGGLFAKVEDPPPLDDWRDEAERYIEGNVGYAVAEFTKLNGPVEVPLTLGGIGGPEIGVATVGADGTVSAVIPSDEPRFNLGQPSRDFEWESTAGLQASPWEYPKPDKVTEADALMPVKFNQPAKPAKRERKPLSTEAAKLKAQLMEVFWSAVSSQKRTQQVTIGPSEIGHPCDRRIGYRVSGMGTVNHRHDGWSAWKGTQIHRGLEEIFREADRGRGRYLVDHSVPISFPLVPRGTLDRADRVLCVIEDDKAVGDNTLSKMWLDGKPSEQYRVQLQTYAWGMAKAGEKFDRVALVAWPAENSDLEENMWVYVEDYDPKVAERALKRVYDIKATVDSECTVETLAMEPSFLCGWCPYYMEDSPDPRFGCRGKNVPRATPAEETGE